MIRMPHRRIRFSQTALTIYIGTLDTAHDFSLPGRLQYQPRSHQTVPIMRLGRSLPIHWDGVGPTTAMWRVADIVNGKHARDSAQHL